MDLQSLQDAYNKGEQPSSFAQRVLAKCSDLGPAFISLLSEDEVLAACKRAEEIPAEERLPIWGAFFAVKDNVNVAGLPTTAACPSFSYKPSASAPAIEALQKAGCICVGKTNMDQFAAGLNGTRSPYGVAVNAVDPLVIPGGSSSGSATAVAAGAVTFAIGTDTAGSGRVPAGLQGIVGVKPSVGLISTTGVVPACASLDCLSVFAKSVDDGAMVAAAMAKAKVPSEDCTVDTQLQSAVFDGPPWQAAPTGESFVFGVPSSAMLNFSGPRGAEYEAACLEEFDKYVNKLSSAWALCTRVEIDLEPFCEVARMLYGTALVAERKAGLRKFLDEHKGTVSGDERLLPVFRAIMGDADKYEAADVFEAQAIVRQRRAECLASMESQAVSIIVVPTVMHHYTVQELQEAEAAGPPFAFNAQLGTFTNFVNLMGMCAVCVPCSVLKGLTGQDPPLKMAFGLTLIGRSGCDAEIWRLARVAEMAIGGAGCDE